MLNQLEERKFPSAFKHLWDRFKSRSTKTFALLFAVGFSLSMAVSACTPSKSEIVAASGNNPASTASKVIRIGRQKYGTLSIVQAKGVLEKRLAPAGVKVQWLEFPAGPQLLEALNAGSIDFGHTGEAPPIFAQAAGAPLVYVAHEPPNPKGEAILVPKDSPIRSVAELKGKKVALNKGSNVHYLLVQALAEAGLKYSDIQPVYLPPADARAAFERGNLDAWVIWDPFYAAAQRATGARTLKDGEGLVANREFYFASRNLVNQNAQTVKAILEETQKVDEWAAKHPQDVATLLSPMLGIDVPTLVEVAERRPYGVQQINGDVIAYQQQIADTFHQLGLLPKPLNVKEVAQLPKL